MLLLFSPLVTFANNKWIYVCVPPNEGGVGNICNHYKNKEGGNSGSSRWATRLINRQREFLSVRSRPSENRQSFCCVAVGGWQPKPIAYIILLSSTENNQEKQQQQHNFPFNVSFLPQRLFFFKTKNKILQRIPECGQSSFRNWWCWWSFSAERKQTTCTTQEQKEK